MSKRLEAEQLMSEIRYQLCPYPTTWGACSCGAGSARGGRRCLACLCGNLSDIAGRELVDNWLDAQRGAMHLERDILDIAERANA